jgi:acyl dehydratase
MMLLDMLPAGERLTLGSYDFDADNIVRFARQYDPHFFHLDEEEARQSVFGGLCASGWHVCAAAMKNFIAFMDREMGKVTGAGEDAPKPGPSPGIRNLKWLKPVYAGDRATFFLTVHSSDPIISRPGRNMCQLTFEGENQDGEKVLSFDCAMIEFV